MPDNYINESIELTEMEKFIRGPHLGQPIFAEQPEEYKAWYREFLAHNPQLARPQK